MSMDLSYYLRGYEISNTAKVVYGLLDGLACASARKGKPYTYISRQSIAERCNVCEKTARTAIKQLKAVGLIVEKRMGRGLNNHIYVIAPNAPKDEARKTIEGADHSIYHSRAVKNPSVYTNAEKVNNSDSKTIYPAQDDKGITPAKGRPTPKRPRRNIEEQRKIKKRYKDYLNSRLRVEEMRKDMCATGEEVEALEKTIEVIAQTMASKGKIAVNGALLLPSQWWYAVKNLTQETIINLIYSVQRAENVRNRRAYFLACLYNSAIQETISAPFYAGSLDNYA